jgi:hypothetical protein
MDDRRAVTQLDHLIEKGEAIPARPADHQWHLGSGERLEPRQFAEWRSQTIAFARSLLGDGHSYLIQFESATEPVVTNEQSDPHVDQREAGVGVLRAIREDVANGCLTGLRRLVAAEVFTDFLEMAEHLLEHGYHHPAASLGGAVLEDGLRRELAARGVRATGNLESMNQIALDQQVYGPLVFKQVKVWIDIRNDADHGKWDRIEAERVASMLRDLPSFLARDLGMADA